MVSVTRKICPGCKQEKDLSEYGPTTGRGMYGRRSRCRECEKLYVRKRNQILRKRHATEGYEVKTEKKCCRCKLVLSVDEFHTKKEVRDGLNGFCKKCSSEACRRWLVNNKKKRKAYRKRYYAKNRERILAKRAEDRKNNPGKARARDKAYHAANLEKEREKCKQYRLRNIEKRRARDRELHAKQRLDPKQNLSFRISKMIGKKLKKGKGGKSWRDLLPYSCETLMRRLKRTIPEGYTWDDFMIGALHIDHKIPIAAFNFEKSEDIDFQRCWALKNLQLLPAQENLKKGARLDCHMQPSLIFD